MKNKESNNQFLGDEELKDRLDDISELLNNLDDFLNSDKVKKPTKES